MTGRTRGALDRKTEHLLRELAPQVLGTLLRRYRDFSDCEDAVQEALIAAANQWPSAGLPEHPQGWLVRVATRRLTDAVRADTARRLREQLVVSLIPIDEQIALAADEVAVERDDSLDLLFICCHPALSQSAQVALTLRAVGGLSTAEIARAFLVPEATMAQRLSRAKQAIRSSGIPLREPSVGDREALLGPVRHVLYLIFNEGYAPSTDRSAPSVAPAVGGADPTAHGERDDLASEAIRLTRMLARSVPADPEVTGLLALMLLTDARRDARTGSSGELVPLDEQDRSRWDAAAIAEGVALLTDALGRSRGTGAVGPYQVQAAIAALHDEAPTFDATDWPQILALYTLLLEMGDNPMVRLSRAIALAMVGERVQGATAALRELDQLARDPRIARHHRLDAVRAHLLERVGEYEAAIHHYRRAASATANLGERNYLLLHAAQLADR